MKTTKKILSIILTVLMLLSFESAVFAAEDNGMGTETNPYKISTAQGLQAINNNVSAHYILTADIDLKDVDFTPIGNADSGAFSGSFDGNGYKIKNLNIFSGKYAGLFGCNEGLIRNVVLENVFVYGTRYVGGVVGQNTALGIIENCSVLSGAIESDGGLYDVYGGGICGYNEGTVKGVLANSASVKIDNSSDNKNSYAGGLIGYTKSETEITDCCNTGTISSYSYSSYYSYSGGLIGYAVSTVTVTNSYNTGNISSSSSYSYSGGLLGYTKSETEITNSYNTGDISATRYWACSGGLIGYANSKTDITNSYNIGDISSEGSNSHSGGLIGYASSTSTVINSYNTGNIYAGAYSGGLIGYASSSTVISSYNTGFVATTTNVWCGGLIGYTFSSTVINSYNTGNVYNNNGSSHSGGLIGYAGSTATVTNSYNTGNIYSSYYSGGLIGRGDSASTITNSYILKSAYKGGYDNTGTILSSAEMKNSSSFADWDFENLWMMPTNGNSGYPVLKNVGSPLSVNISNSVLVAGETIQLAAYKNGTAISNVEWSCSYGKSVVSKKGVVTAVAGYSTITATDSEGNKANCNIYVMSQANLSAKIDDFSVNQGNSISSSCSFGNSSSGDFLVDVSSSNSDIISINYYTDTGIVFSANNPGTATISIETAQGFKDTCIATVTNYTEKISIDRSSLTAARGSSYQLNATTTPYFSSSPVSWSSSNPDVVTVDSTGKVTCVALGTAIVYARSNGKDASCTVTVTAPVTSMAFEKYETKLYVQDSEQLKLIFDPADTTDTVSYSSSNTSVVTVSSTGLVTAKATAGTAVITATSSSGIKAYHTVKVMNYPVVVTDITLDQSEKDLLVGEVFKLKATVTPSNATSPGVTWASTDETVATVSNSGTVEAIGAGKTLITAETENGIIAYCIVNVTGVASTNLSKIYVPDVIASENSTVDIPVIIEKNPGISFASIRIIYDPDVMEAVSVENGTVFNSVTGTIDTDESTVRLFFTSQSNVTADGILAKIRFNILDNTKEASVKVCYFPSEIRNDAMEAVSFNLRDGRYVQFTCEHSETEVRDVVAATCTSDGYSGDEYCIDCGTLIQDGSIILANEHDFADATCTAPKTCKVCDATEGVANGHNYADATCTKAKTCTVCGATSGKANGHNFAAATCTDPKTCIVCNTTEGSAKGHDYAAATCTKPKTCKVCKATTGSANGHNYAAATCTKAKTCKTCGATSGKANGHKYTNACDTSCNTCKVTRKITHAYKDVITKATLTKSGKIVNKCSVCGTVKSTKTIAYAKTIKLSATSYTYDGKAKTPTVTVKDSAGKTLKSGTDYTVTYASGRKNVGQYKVTITFKGNYSGTKTLTFNILPGKTSKITVTPATTSLKATWNKVTGATGYKVELINSSGKVVKLAITTKLTYTFSKLTAGTNYKVKVTAYKTISGKNQYSTVSTTLATATKVATPTLKVTSTKKGVANFTWTNVAGENGYEVYYSTSKSSGFKTLASYKTNVAKGSKSKLTSGKTYYFKVRAFKTVNGKKVYGDWSKVVSVKVK